MWLKLWIADVNCRVGLEQDLKNPVEIAEKIREENNAGNMLIVEGLFLLCIDISCLTECFCLVLQLYVGVDVYPNFDLTVI